VSIEHSIVRAARPESWRSLQLRVAPILQQTLNSARLRRLEETVTALERHLIGTLRTTEDASAFLNRLFEVRKQCNEEIYNRPMAAEAYAYTHLANRYVRWWNVFQKLFESGYLPMRRSGINVMDIGSGPAPASYALLDFMTSIEEAVAAIPDSLAAKRLTTDPSRVVLAEKSVAMARLVHRVSEYRPLGGMYSVAIPDIFDLQLVMTKEANALRRERLLHDIMSQWGDELGYDAALQILGSDHPNWHSPERFHLCLVGYLLTTDDMLERANRVLKEIKRTLPPGGTIVVMGGKGPGYQAIHARLRDRMRGLHHLQISQRIKVAFDDEQLQLLLKNFYIRIRRHVRNLVTDTQDSALLAGDHYLRRLWDPNCKIPSATFMIEVFRAPNGRGRYGSGL
jgi:hypothetical protein